VTNDNTDLLREISIAAAKEAEAEAKIADADRQLEDLRARLDAVVEAAPNPYRRPGDPSIDDLASLPQSDYDSYLDNDPTLTERLLKAREWEARQPQLAEERRHQQEAEERHRQAVADPVAFERQRRIEELRVPRGAYWRLSAKQRTAEASRLGIDPAELAQAHANDWPTLPDTIPDQEGEQ
jgi:hypothetical protein